MAFYRTQLVAQGPQAAGNQKGRILSPEIFGDHIKIHILAQPMSTESILWEQGQIIYMLNQLSFIRVQQQEPILKKYHDLP